MDYVVPLRTSDTKPRSSLTGSRLAGDRSLKVTRAPSTPGTGKYFSLGILCSGCGCWLREILCLRVAAMHTGHGLASRLAGIALQTEQRTDRQSKRQRRTRTRCEPSAAHEAVHRLSIVMCYDAHCAVVGPPRCWITQPTRNFFLNHYAQLR